jgi:hypothetical protein
MSTGLQCLLMEPAPRQWYYVLQLGSCPVDVWDWTEYAKVVGPFGSEDAASDALGANEANPGGWDTYSYERLQGLPDERLVKYRALTTKAVRR